MTEFIQINILLCLTYILYVFVFKHKQDPLHNRVFLLAGIAFSVCVPWIELGLAGTLNVAASAPIARTLPAIVVSSTEIVPGGLPNTIGWLYLLPSLLLAAVLIAAFIRINRIPRKALADYAGYKRYLVPEGYGTFSFYDRIFVDSTDTNPLILEHEARHLDQRHYIDILLTEFLVIACWINPLVWLLRKEVRENLEYAADISVLEKHAESTKEYIELLVGSNRHYKPQIASNFYNNSLTYRRCKRLLRADNFKFNTMRNIAILPLVAILFYFTACDSGDKPIEKRVEIERELGDPPSKDEIVSFPGGDQALINYLMENTKYPASAKEAGIEGKSLVAFKVDRDGAVHGVELKESSGNEALDKEAMRVIGEMPQWDSKVSDEEAEIKIELVIPIVFKLPETD